MAKRKLIVHTSLHVNISGPKQRMAFRHAEDLVRSVQRLTRQLLWERKTLKGFRVDFC